MRVLLIESNIPQAKAFLAILKAETIRADIADVGKDAVYFMSQCDYDLVLLNLLLPDMDGNALIKSIRSAKYNTPIIALSTVPHARLEALGAGADDVVERDIDQAELCARIRAVVRRSRSFYRSQLQIGSLILDVDHQEVVANGVRVHLTVKEFALLQLLVLRRNMIMTKDAILSQLYGGMDEPEIKIVDVFICKIRSKLTKAGLPNLISTVWGRGYTVKDTGSEAPLIVPQLFARIETTSAAVCTADKMKLAHVD